MARIAAMRWLAALALCAVPLLPVRAAAAEPEATEANRAAAQEAYRHALELFDQRQHAAALAEFRRAYALAPSFRILYNVGLTHVALGDPSSAVEAFDQYLKQGGDKVPAARRNEVQTEIARLSSQLAVLDIDVEQPGAELSLDGEPLGRGPISRQLRLNPGRHTATVRSPDGTLRTQTVSIGRGQEQHLRFSSTVTGVTPAAALAPADSSPASKPRPARSSAPYIAWGVTGALGVATGAVGILAFGAHADQLNTKARRGVTTGELNAAADRVETRALATDILLGATVVAAGVSLYLTFRPSPESDSVAELQLAPSGVWLSHTF